jgi:hypothetical protein
VGRVLVLCVFLSGEAKQDERKQVEDDDVMWASKPEARHTVTLLNDGIDHPYLCNTCL